MYIRVVRFKCHSMRYDTGFIIDCAVQSCFPDSKHADDVTVSMKSKVRFHIMLLKPRRRADSQTQAHGLCNLELKCCWSLVHCKRPDIPLQS